MVSGSFQAYDQTYLVDALAQLGADFFGVANVPPDIADDEVLALAAAGVRAFRVNLFRGGDLDGSTLAAALRRARGLARGGLPRRARPAGAGPAPAQRPRLVIDHLGRRRPACRRCWSSSSRRVRQGQRLRADRPRRARGAARRSRAVNPGALLFGSDLPSTRALRPFSDGDIELVRDAAGPRALYDNAAALYR